MPTPEPTTTSASSSSNATPATPSPQPSPDPNAALAAFALQAVAMIATIKAGLGDPPALAPSDKRRAVRFRKGGGPIVATIGDLAQQQQLELAALPVATMTSLLERATALAPLVSGLPSLTRLVGDMVFVAQSQAWEMALQYYAILRRRAKTDAKLAAALQPVTEFLAYRHPSTKPPVGSPTTKQVNAAKKAQKALAKVAGGKLAGASLLAPRKKVAVSAAPAGATASPVPAGNGAPR